MSLEKLKSVYFLGSLIKNVKGIYLKLNETVDYVNALETSVAPTYSVFEGLLDQPGGSNAPIIDSFNVNELSIEDADFGYTSTGIFTLTKTGAFPIGKTFLFINGFQGTIASGNQYITSITHTDANTITFECYTLTVDIGGVLIKTPSNTGFYPYVKIIVKN